MAFSIKALSVKQMEDSFYEGNFEKNCKGQTVKSPEEISCYDFFILKSKNDLITMNKYLSIYSRYPDTFYGQMALLEAGKLYLLNRDYDAAQKNLEKIDAEIIPEKHYWLAHVEFKKANYDKAISYAQKYIIDSKDKARSEVANFIIAESYIQQEKYQRALNTLVYLQESAQIENSIALLHFKTGYSHENTGNIDQATKYYKKVMLDFPYSKYAISAEKRMYDLMYSKNINITDINTLDQNNPDINKDLSAPENQIKSISHGNYLQTGVFSTISNAENQKKRLNDLDFQSVVFEKIVNNKTFYAVAVGPVKDKKAVKKMTDKLKEKGFECFLIEK